MGNYYEVTNGVALKYYYFGKQRVAMRTAAGVVYLHSDHLGSTSATSGASVSTQTYYAYGNIRSTTGTVPTDFGFTGQRRDASAGLMYYGNSNLYGRYYDTTLGRFTQPDFVVPDNFNPQDFNRYSYARNNPLAYTDASGHCAIVCTAIIGAVAGGLFAYGIQVYDNYQKYGMTTDTFTQVDGGKIAAGVVGGAVFGATLGLATPVLAAAVPASLGTTGTAIAAGAGGGLVAGVTSGMAQRATAPVWNQAVSALSGNGFNGDAFLNDVTAAGILDPNSITVDAVSGVVSAGVGGVAGKVFQRLGMYPNSALRSMNTSEPVVTVKFVRPNEIIFDNGNKYYMNAVQFDRWMYLIKTGAYDAAADLLSNLSQHEVEKNLAGPEPEQ